MSEPITPEAQAAAEWTAFYRAFGEMFLEWAEFELVLGLMLGHLLGTDQFRTRVIWASSPNFYARKKLLLRLSETFMHDDDLPAFRGLIKRAGRLVSNRNMVAHSLGGLEAGKNKFVFLWDDDDEKMGFDFVRQQVVHLENVKGWTTAIIALRNDLYAFKKTVRVHASPKMHRPPPGDHAPNTA